MVDNLLNSVALRWALVAVALGLLALAAFRLYGAGAYYYEGDYFYLWEDSSANVCDENTDWSDASEDAAENFDEDTDLTLTWQDPCVNRTREIINSQNDYGAIKWMGFAYTYTDNGTDPCWDWDWTGNCDSTNNKVDFAGILWNEYYEDDIDDEPEWQALHELGHVFGLRHPTLTECDDPDPSVMFSVYSRWEDCDTFYDELQQQDIDDINDEY